MKGQSDVADAKACAHPEFMGQPAGFTPTSWRCVDCGLTMTAGEFEIRRELKYPTQYAAELTILRQRAERAEATANRALSEYQELHGKYQVSLSVASKVVDALGIPDSAESHYEAILAKLPEIKAAQSTIADLNGQVERMREAIERVCALAADVIGDSKITSASPAAYRLAQEASDILRAALGGAA